MVIPATKTPKRLCAENSNKTHALILTGELKSSLGNTSICKSDYQIGVIFGSEEELLFSSHTDLFKITDILITSYSGYSQKHTSSMIFRCSETGEA